MFRVPRLDPEHKNPSSETVLRAGQAAGPSLLALSAWNLHARLEHWNIRVLAVSGGLQATPHQAAQELRSQYWMLVTVVLVCTTLQCLNVFLWHIWCAMCSLLSHTLRFTCNCVLLCIADMCQTDCCKVLLMTCNLIYSLIWNAK